ncbi:MAG: zeta-carotene desaturase [[Candidatus Thermochlorobacteriaceae] bacterium GBChlB]|nr:MAG: zeta-carotene desaturase [[Candidatus Thermochlorobacteriaceae] bacterium GBChlB]
MKIAIFGGGIAGLTAAIHLLDKGYEVDLYEKRSVLGGKVSVWKDSDGDSIESGLHVVFGGYKELQSMLKKIGAEKHFEWKDLSLVYAEKGGRQTRFEKVQGLPSPVAELVGGLKTNVITWRDKLSLVRGLLPLLLFGNEGYFRSQDDLTYSDWHARHGCTDNSLQRLWRPISLALNFIEPNVISARPMVTIFNYFGRNYEDARFGFFKANPGESMIAPMKTYIEERGGKIFTNARLKEFILNDNETIQSIALGDGRFVEADAYISALPVHSLKKLIPKAWLAHEYFYNLFHFVGSPVANCQLWFDKKITDTNNLMFAHGTTFATFADVSITCPQDFQAGQGTATGGSVLSLVLAPAHHLMHLPNEVITARVMEELKTIFPKAREAKLLKSTIVKIPESVYKAVPGVDKFRPDQASPIENFFLCGDYTYQKYLASMEGAALSGRHVAEKLSAKLKHHAHTPAETV